jgi:hypothetical protein
MKWEFFYDEGYYEPYKSIRDWFKAIKHLIVALVVMVVLGIFAFLYVKFIYSIE